MYKSPHPASYWRSALGSTTASVIAASMILVAPIAHASEDATKAPQVAVAGTTPAIPPPSQTSATRLGGLADALADAALIPQDLRAFYQNRGYEPLWLTGQADQDQRINNLLNAFNQVSRHGLRAPRPPEDWAELSDAQKETFLSTQALRLGRALSGGTLIPADPRISEIPKPAATALILAPLGLSPTPGDALLALAPQTSLYKGLMAALVEARAAAAKAPWPKVPENGKLSPDDNAPEVIALRARLVASGDYQADQTTMASTHYDPGLEAAVKAFQERNSLDVDGVIGKGTRSALNISPGQRVDQIKVNLDRLRRLPDDLGQRYLVVNVAGYQAWLFQDETLVFDTPIIVGKSENQTPTFSNIIRSVEFNPSWEVPRSIGLKEILPKMAKDPTYVASQNMDVYEGWENGGTLIDPTTVDWVQLAKSGTLPYRFRQRPGKGNSLGRVKLLFPNKHDVYLHDTPTRGLFRRGQRAFSHGCMRVGKPLELAGVVLGIEDSAIASMIDRGEQKRLLVRNPLPIHITYLTAWIDPTKGTLHYAADIYGRDSGLMAQLHPLGEPPESAEDTASAPSGQPPLPPT